MKNTKTSGEGCPDIVLLDDIGNKCWRLVYLFISYRTIPRTTKVSIYVHVLALISDTLFELEQGIKTILVFGNDAYFR